jgi:hypothetical protein
MQLRLQWRNNRLICFFELLPCTKQGGLYCRIVDTTLVVAIVIILYLARCIGQPVSGKLQETFLSKAHYRGIGRPALDKSNVFLLAS